MAARIESIDQYRGFTIIMMIAANFLAGVNAVPVWFRHAPDIGFTVIDQIAPMFIFAIALTYPASVKRRLEKDGRLKTFAHFSRRYLALIGIGALFNALEAVFVGNGAVHYWSVLHALGFAGLCVFPLLFLKPRLRLVTALAGLVCYQVLLDKFFLDTVLSSSHGGIIGALSWTLMLLLATAVTELALKKEKRSILMLAGFSILLLAAGIVLSRFSALSKNRVSAAYVLLSTGLSGIIYLLFRILLDRYQLKVPFAGSRFCEIGRNPLLMYILHYVLFSLFVLPGAAWWYEQAVIWLALLQLAVILVIVSMIAYLLDKRQIYGIL